MNNSFSKELRLLSKEDFLNLRENPRFVSSGLFLFFFKPNSSIKKQTRLGISVSKKISKKAVDRNSLKRKVREIFRTSEFKNLAVDVLVVLNKKKFKDMGSAKQSLETDLLGGLSKLSNS